MTQIASPDTSDKRDLFIVVAILCDTERKVKLLDHLLGHPDPP